MWWVFECLFAGGFNSVGLVDSLIFVVVILPCRGVLCSWFRLFCLVICVLYCLQFLVIVGWLIDVILIMLGGVWGCMVV